MTKAELKKLVLKMLKTFSDLGNDPMARIDSRLWNGYYRKKVKKMGLVVPLTMNRIGNRKSN